MIENQLIIQEIWEKEMVDVLVLNYNDYVTTTSFVELVKKFSNVGRILIVDNKSTDDSLERLKYIQSQKVFLLESPQNGGYGAGNNLGVRYLSERFHSEYILLSNPDVIVSEKVLLKMEDFLRSHSDYAIVSPFMCNAEGVRQGNTALRIPSKWEYILSSDLLLKKYIHSFNYETIELENAGVKDVGCVSGSMFLMRTEDMLKYGMYDESIFLYCEEVVLGKKILKSGKKIGLLTNLNYIHNHSVSISRTFNSIVSKHRLYLQSKMYVIKKYFDANFFDCFIANFLSITSMMEIRLVAFFRKIKK